MGPYAGGGDPLDPRSLIHQLWHLTTNEAEKRIDGGEALVTSGEAVAAVIFEVGEEAAHHIGSELPDGEAGRVVKL